MEHKRTHPKHGKLTITTYQAEVLDAMNRLRREEYPFVDLSELRSDTIRALEQLGYIAPQGLGSSNYRLTGFGMEALRLFQLPRIYRTDNLCPRCGKRPRHSYRSGSTATYCTQCLRKAKREYRRKQSADQPCTRCGATPRHVGSGGDVSSYCDKCFTEIHRSARERRNERLLAEIAAGRVPTCAAEGCDQPVRYTDRHVSNHCIEHERMYNRESYRRRREKWAKEAAAYLKQRGAEGAA